MKANLIEAGDIHVAVSEDDHSPTKIPFALLIECGSAEAVREAMKTGMVEFTIFEHYSTAPKP